MVTFPAMRGCLKLNNVKVKTVKVHHIFFLCLCFSLVETSFANLIISDTTTSKIGYVFSGGGARALAHIGVLKVLEEEGIRPDFITGTSMGSIIGALYATGYSANQLDSLARALDWNLLFTDEIPRSLQSLPQRMIGDRFTFAFPVNRKEGVLLPKGLIAGQQISLKLTELFWPYLKVDDFEKLPIPFGCVAMDLETGESIFLNQGYLTDAIRSSISIPTVFSPNKDVITNKLLVDGGWVNNLPIREVKEMGAHTIVAIDVTDEPLKRDELDNLVNVMVQSNRFRTIDEIQDQLSLVDILIKPLGEQPYTQDFDKVDTLIALGEIAARKQMDSIRKLAEKIKKQEEFIKRASVTPINLSQIRIIGIPDKNQKNYTQFKQDLINTSILPKDIYAAVNSLYAKGYFSSVKHQIIPDVDNEGEYELIFYVEPKEEGILRAGIRFDDQNHSALLIQFVKNNLFNAKSAFLATARLGRDRSFQIEQYQLNDGEWFGYQVGARFLDRHVDAFQDGSRFANYNLLQFTSFLRVGTILNNSILISPGIRYDYYLAQNEINIDQLGLDSEEALYSFTLTAMHENLDRNWFPTSGTLWIANWQASNTWLGREEEYSTLRIQQLSRYSPADIVTIGLDVFLQRNTGKLTPTHQWSYAPTETYELMQDYSFFYGIERMGFNGKNMMIANGLVQWNLNRRNVIGLHYSYGGPMRRMQAISDFQELDHGFGMSYGNQTIIGPFQIILASSEINALQLHVRLGYNF